MVRSPVYRGQPRSPRSVRPQRGSSPSFPRPLHRRTSASPNRRRPNSRGPVGSPCDDPRRRLSSPHHNKDGRHRGSQGGGPHQGNGHGQPRLSDTNRTPVASMRMRMDDYTPPKHRRNDQGTVIPPLMEQVVVRARREASTRTKDTFWTKKLLDAEDQYSKRGDRWAHSGFKELYRDELGYSEPEQPPPSSGGPPAAGGGGPEDGAHKSRPDNRDPQGSRDPRGEPRDPRRGSPNRPRDPRGKPRDPRDGRPSAERPRDPRDPRNASGRPRDPRRAGEGGPVLPRDGGSPHRKSSRSRGRGDVKQAPSKRRRRRRSYSGSYSSGSSSSSSGSYSRSRSYYSRSSYSQSSSGSSSYSSSSSSRSRSRKRTYGKRRRSHSGSRSYSSSLSPPRNRVKGGGPNQVKRGGARPLPPPPNAKERKPSLLQESSKKVVTKTVSNVVTTKTKLINNSGVSHVKQNHRTKAKLKIKEDESQRKKIHNRPPSHPDMNPGANMVPSASYYPNDEINDATIASRNTNCLPPRNMSGAVGGLSNSMVPPLSVPQQPILAVAVQPHPQQQHHHHKSEHYPAKTLSKKVAPPPGVPHQHPAEFPPPVDGPSIPGGSVSTSVVKPNKTLTNNPPSPPHSQNEESGESSSSSEEEELPRKMTLSERFGKLAQLSSQRQEYDGVRMKIVREGGQDKKVYLETGLGSRSPSPLHPGHERWLAEHQTEYADYQRRYGDVRSWDPHRDLPRDLPPNWEEVEVRYRYYKQSGYFGDRHISLEDYLKWEDWWYQYRDWLKKYGGAADAAAAAMPRLGKDGEGWGDAVAYDRGRVAARWPQDTPSHDRKRRRF